jgi:3-deoxy-7-phosphoheptulonate synthase/chorismate mutase
MGESSKLEQLRLQVDKVNHQLLDLISERARLVKEIGLVKEKQGVPKFDPAREKAMLEQLTDVNPGPFDSSAIRHIFKEIFKASLELQGQTHRKQLLVSRQKQAEDTVVEIKGVRIGGGESLMVAGPCSVESYEQLRTIAGALKQEGVPMLRGGAFKPRTSPYDFQGLGVEGLRIMRQVADEFGLLAVSEIVDSSMIGQAAEFLDVIQIGARNMQNFELLKAAGDARIPVLLKRGLAATMEEWLHAAEYIVSRGNTQVILVERGIRSYERWTRNTLDISAVPIIKQESHLPVLVDVSHATGRKDILAPCAKAALAAGADGIMVEVHPDPPTALSDAEQQLDIPQFSELFREIKQSGLFKI